MLRVIVQDAKGKAVANVPVTVVAEDGKQWKGATNDKGLWQISLPPAGIYSVTVSGEGFQEQSQKIAISAGTPIELQFTALKKITVEQQVNVQGTPENPVQVGSSPPAELQREVVKSAPSRPATVADALPLLPGVTRSQDGQLEIAGAKEVHSAMLVNSIDVTDPQTGEFGTTIPVDSVESINVYKTPFLAEYGRFTSGVVDVETRRGAEKWNYDLEDPFPEFRIRSGHLAGLRNATPRLSFGGPVRKNRLFTATSIEYVLDKKPVRTLPFPFNETRQQALNMFTQLDYVWSNDHLLTATFHSAPQNVRFLNLDFFNPQPVTPNLDSLDQTATVIDRLNLSSGVLQSTFAARTSDLSIDPQGTASMTLAPAGNSGNYFSSQDRSARRYEGREDFSFKPIAVIGAHNIQTGVEASGTNTDGSFSARPVNIVDTEGRLRQSIQFQGGAPYDKSDLELDGFVQDHWVMSKRLSFDAGTRLENQRLSSALRLAPRLGFAFSPFPNLHTVIRGGAGVFYEHVPLSVYAFRSYPEQVVTTYDTSGNIIDGPREFLNVLAQHHAHMLLAHRGERVGNFVPYSIAENLEVEQQVSTHVKVRVGYLQNDSQGLVVINPGKVRSFDALILNQNGASRYRQLEVTSVVKFKSLREMFFSYVRSRSRGNLNQFNGYLGDVPYPVIQPGQFTNLSGDLPNRFLAWGTVGLPLKIEMAPMVEVHTGFPYAVTDVFQKYVGIANSDDTRFPDFFSLDARLRRAFPVTPKYSLQFGVRGLNLTNHFNALAVHSNIADPQFGQFFGTYKRRFLLDFDVLF